MSAAWPNASVPPSATETLPASPPSPMPSRPAVMTAPDSNVPAPNEAVPPLTVTSPATVPEVNSAVPAETPSVPASRALRTSSVPPPTVASPATFTAVEASPSCNVPADTVVAPDDELETSSVIRPVPLLVNTPEPPMEPAPPSV